VSDLKQDCPELHFIMTHSRGGARPLAQRELDAYIAKRELIAAAKMQERCRLVVLNEHCALLDSAAADTTARIIDAIDEIDPSEKAGGRP